MRAAFVDRVGALPGGATVTGAHLHDLWIAAELVVPDDVDCSLELALGARIDSQRRGVVDPYPAEQSLTTTHIIGYVGVEDWRNVGDFAGCRPGRTAVGGLGEVDCVDIADAAGELLPRNVDVAVGRYRRNRSLSSFVYQGGAAHSRCAHENKGLTHGGEKGARYVEPPEEGAGGVGVDRHKRLV